MSGTFMFRKTTASNVPIDLAVQASVVTASIVSSAFWTAEVIPFGEVD